MYVDIMQKLLLTLVLFVFISVAEANPAFNLCYIYPNHPICRSSRGDFKSDEVDKNEIKGPIADANSNICKKRPGLPWCRKRDGVKSDEVDKNEIKGPIADANSNICKKRPGLPWCRKRDGVKSDEVDKNEIKATNDLEYLKILSSAAKDVVNGMKVDDDSMQKTMVDLGLLKDTFVSVVKDMRTKNRIKKLVEPLKDVMKSIAHTIHKKLEA